MSARRPFVSGHLFVVYQRYKDHAADDIAEYGGGDELTDRRAPPPSASGRYEQRLDGARDRVPEPERADRGRREPDQRDLRTGHLGSGDEPCGEGDEPPREDAAVEGEGGSA